MPTSAFLQPVRQGFRFVVIDRPRDAAVRGSVVLAPAFAEEMNKSRRMVALAARGLAADGWQVSRPDLLGCGDSSGDFGDATWADWIADMRRCADEAARAGGMLWLWGLRAGALLLPALLADFPEANLLLWQPALSGEVVLSQFLRLKTVGALNAERAVGRSQLFRRLTEDGEAVEIAGYRLSPGVARGLNAARLDLPPSYRGRIVWLGTGSSAEPPPGADADRIAQWQRAGVSVRTEFVAGAPFWQTVEISEVPLLIERTRALLLQDAAIGAPAGTEPVTA